MAASLSSKVLREYLSDDSFRSKVSILKDLTEYQLCLAFAIDSDQKGNFTAGWDTAKVTPDVINDFRTNCKVSNVKLKVLLGIGGEDNSFNIDCGASDWILSATKSLHDIINKYHLDGIDVSYTSIEGDTDFFVECIRDLIASLKKASNQTGNIFVASIATTVSTNDDYYFPLFKAAANDIETVVIQSYIDFTPEGHGKQVKSLVTKIEDIAGQYDDYVQYKKKILLGYSLIKEDWSKISPPLVFLALYVLVQKFKVKGASIKIINATKASFPPKWIPTVLSLVASTAV